MTFTGGLDENVREVALMGEQEGKPDREERWLFFSREAHHLGKLVGHVEIAFSLSIDAESPRAIQPLAESLLVVFLPTVLSTHLGFLLQRPYRTTASRETVPINDRWSHLHEWHRPPLGTLP
jgi:hypothetical protein